MPGSLLKLNKNINKNKIEKIKVPNNNKPHYKKVKYNFSKYFFCFVLKLNSVKFKHAKYWAMVTLFTQTLSVNEKEILYISKK